MIENRDRRLALSSKRRWMIAMKGAPFTKKTEFACLIAASLSCPLLSMEDVLDVLHPDHVHISPCPNTSIPPSQLPQDLAFQIICNMAKSHLSTGVSDKVVIDSPLTSRSHLDQLIKQASSMQMRLLIVECKPENTYLWKSKFEEHLDKSPHLKRKWFKAKNWDEVIKETTQHEDAVDERSDGYKVSKLVLDPLLDYLCRFPIILLFSHLSLNFEPPRFMEAIKHMMEREDGDGPTVVVYRQWELNSCTSPDAAGESSQPKETEIPNRSYCKNGHTITKYPEELGAEFTEVKCTACGNQIKGGGAYSCSSCILALHKECAESFDKNSTRGNPCYRSPLKSASYRFPQVFDCASCKENGKAFSEECTSCLFETHLRCRRMPTVIKHCCDEHFLSIVLLPANAYYHDVHMCFACGTGVELISYTCKICCTYYHFHCLNEIPVQLKHEHGGHHHQLLLKFNDCDKADDYICDECQEIRDPEKWFYYCNDCQYYLHLGCSQVRGVLEYNKPMDLASYMKKWAFDD